MSPPVFTAALSTAAQRGGGPHVRQQVSDLTPARAFNAVGGRSGPEQTLAQAAMWTGPETMWPQEPDTRGQRLCGATWVKGPSGQVQRRQADRWLPGEGRSRW